MKKSLFYYHTPAFRTMLAAMVIFTSTLSAQKYDTLHLYYNQVSVQPHDTTLAKMDKWIKSLNGKHQDIKIVAYYHKLEFKKYAQERVDEMFLIVNRKARSLFTIGEMVPLKGKDYQRTTVDIIYTPSAGSQMTTDPGKTAAKEMKVEKAKEPEVKAKKVTEPKAEKEAEANGKTKKGENSEAKTSGKYSEADKNTQVSKSEEGSEKKKDKEPAKRENNGKQAEGAKVKDTKTETWEAKPID